jgi:hypothetical protein
VTKLGPTIESEELSDGTITNADISLAAAIAGTKITPDFGSQTLLTLGQMGIGTTSPARQVHVLNNAGNPVIRLATDNLAAAAMVEIGRTANLWTVGTTGPAQDDFFISNSAGVRLYLAPGGNVGIGTIAPTRTLDVAGTVKATAFQGDGAGLTGVAASSLAAGTYPNLYNFTNTGSTYAGATFTGGLLTSGTGLPLTVRSANGTGSGGALTIRAGDAGVAGGGAGGDLTLQAGGALPQGGVGYTNQGPAGKVALTAGTGYNGVGGNVTLASGTNSNWSLTLGARSKVSLQGGGLLGGDGATIDVEGAGSGSTSNAPLSYGGNVKITAGTGIGGLAGGHILLLPGAGSPTGNVGIGTTAPTQKLDVAGTIQMSSLKLPTGAGSGLVLTSDASGVGTWQAAGGGGGGWTDDGTAVRLTTSTDSVGIGTTSPLAELHISKYKNGAHLLMRIENTGPFSAAGVHLKTQAAGSDWLIDAHETGGGAADGFHVHGTMGIPFTIKAGTGNVGIGTTSPAYVLDVAGAAHASSFPTSSDLRLKTNVASLANVIPKLEQIRGVSFDWNEAYQAMGRATGHREIGVIAQEVEAVFPELVTTWGSEGYKAVDYGRLTGVLIEAIKELHAELSALRQEQQVLRQRLEAIEAR